jgi:hypothetical protein
VTGSDQRAVAWMLGAFVVTFLVTRLITRLIRAGRGPFRDMSVGGVHLHHQVFGIFLLLGTGALEIAYRMLMGFSRSTRTRATVRSSSAPPSRSM